MVTIKSPEVLESSEKNEPNNVRINRATREKSNNSNKPRNSWEIERFESSQAAQKKICGVNTKRFFKLFGLYRYDEEPSISDNE